MNSRLGKMIMTAFFTALICVCTLAVRIPTVSGYTNLGDCAVLLSAYFMGPVYGFAAGAAGSALADLLAGYAHYMPGTFVIKGLTALFAALLFKKARSAKLPVRLAVSGVPSELFMAAGYFAYKSLILGKPEGALLSVPGNLIQGAVGVVVSSLLYSFLIKIPEIKNNVWKG
ncbi:MAG: ECF transporter S component [Clostridia bacterium]|nr:ECF transporter S component [Clostridia bacterium]